MAAARGFRNVGDMTSAHPTVHRSRPKARGGRGDGQVVGLLLVVSGVAWLLHQAGVLNFGFEGVLSSLLIALGIGMVMTARRAGGTGLVIAGVVLTATLVASSSAPNLDTASFRKGIGDRTYAPAFLPTGGTNYRLGAGSMTVDLRQVVPFEGERTLAVRLGVGELIVEVPADVAVSVKAHANTGKVEVLQAIPQKGTGGVDSVFEEPGYAEATHRLRLDLRIEVGSITVVRAKG